MARRVDFYGHHLQTDSYFRWCVCCNYLDDLFVLFNIYNYGPKKIGRGVSAASLVGIMASITARDLIRQSAGYEKWFIEKVPGVAYF